MVNYSYLGVAIAAGFVGVMICTLSPILVIGEATKACVEVSTLVCGSICGFFTFAGFASQRQQFSDVKGV